MSKIDDQIKLLQLKKKKIDYVSYIADLLKGDTKCIDYRDVKEEVLSKVEPFLLQLMTAIENDAPIQSSPESSTGLSAAELEILKVVANKALIKTTQPQNQTPQVQTQAQPKEVEVSNSDKLTFAMNNRHLANKRVSVMNDKNVDIRGKVVGLDAPFVHVKTDTGPTIKAPLEAVVLE